MPRLKSRKRPPVRVRTLQRMVVNGAHCEPGHEFELPANDADYLALVGRVQPASEPPPPWLDSMKSKPYGPVKLKTIRAFAGHSGRVHLPGDEFQADGVTARNLIAGGIAESA
jgi:hypothetical protein